MNSALFLLTIEIEISTVLNQFSTPVRDNTWWPMTDFLVALQALPIHACEQTALKKTKNG